MDQNFEQYLQSEPLAAIAALGLMFFLYVVLVLLPTAGFLYGVYFLLTLPMRRKERARLFLDLLELGLQDGRTPEAAIAEAGHSRDASLGAKFHAVATYMTQGLRLSQALDFVPHLLPPEVTAILTTGERLGNIGKVLPACRWKLRDGVSHVRGALNYLMLLAIVVTPVSIVVPLVIRVKILPSFLQVYEGMGAGAALPAFTRFVFGTNSIFSLLQVLLLVLVWLAVLAYVGGPRLRSALDLILPGLTDRMAYLLPWRRKRLLRDFSATLALLLEAGVPEPEAVRLAARSTANVVVRQRAEQVRARLEDGVKLPDALSTLDSSGQLRWRLANALQSRNSFVRALNGWHEALDAKAFQQEQTAAQVTTTFLVLFNGFVVGSVVIAIFLVLVQLIYSAALW